MTKGSLRSCSTRLRCTPLMLGVPNKVTSPKAHDRWCNNLFIQLRMTEINFGHEAKYIRKRTFKCFPSSTHRLKRSSYAYLAIV